MTSLPVRIGLIGAGANTRKMHLPHLQSIESVTVTEVANRTTASAQRVASEFNIPVVREHWQEVATSPNVDAVVIGTWPYLHAEATCAALQAGKHVLCEARMAMDAAEARRMRETALRYPNLVAQVVPSPFTLHVDQTIQRLLLKGTLGILRNFSFEFAGPPSMTPGAPIHWRRNRKYSGLNTMMLGIAYESLLRWLGPAQWVSAVSRVCINQGTDPETGEPVSIEIPDYLSLNMQLPNGVMGSMRLFETTGPIPPPCFRLYGEHATLEAAFQVDGELRIGHKGEATLSPVAIPPDEAGHWRVEEEFINAIRGQEKITHTPFETGVEYMVFTEAVHRSAQKNGMPVSLSEI